MGNAIKYGEFHPNFQHDLSVLREPIQLKKEGLLISPTDETRHAGKVIFDLKELDNCSYSTAHHNVLKKVDNTFSLQGNGHQAIVSLKNFDILEKHTFYRPVIEKLGYHSASMWTLCLDEALLKHDGHQRLCVVFSQDREKVKPTSAIKKLWKLGYDILQVSFGNSKWVILAEYTEKPTPTQFFNFSRSLPVRPIQEAWNEGRCVRHVTHDDDLWVLITEEAADYDGSQRLVEKTTFSDAEKEIHNLWEEGRRIHTMVYGDNRWILIGERVEDSKDPRELQKFFTATDYPKEKIDKTLASGGRINSICYSSHVKLWAVITEGSEDTNYTQRVYSDPYFPDIYIKPYIVTPGVSTGKPETRQPTVETKKRSSSKMRRKSVTMEAKYRNALALKEAEIKQLKEEVKDLTQEVKKLKKSNIDLQELLATSTSMNNKVLLEAENNTNINTLETEAAPETQIDGQEEDDQQSDQISVQMPPSIIAIKNSQDSSNDLTRTNSDIVMVQPDKATLLKNSNQESL